MVDDDAYYALRADEPVDEGVARVVRGCVDDAVARVDDALAGDPDPGDEAVHEALHETRKRCKEVRAAARLVRGAYPDYSETNAHFRDLARELSEIRDATALVETYGEFVAPLLDDPEPFRERLVERRDALARDRDVLGRLASARETLLAGRETYAEAPFELSESGFAAVEGGLKRSYRRGRDRLADAAAEPETEAFHEWRKRVKYHWYHTLLLKGLWPREMATRATELKRLSDHLGDEHDLAVFVESLATEPALAREAPDDLLAAVAERRAGLQSRAFPLGRRTHAEPPGALAERFGRYWTVWRAEVTDEAGAIPAELRALDEALALASTDGAGESTADGSGDEG
jgi:CHAD domain-containing protein